MSKVQRRLGPAGCLVFVVLTVAVLAAGLSSMFRGPYDRAVPQRFDPRKWQAADGGSTTRCSMLRDLTGRVGVVGKTRSELERMLGPAEDEDDDPAMSHWHVCPSFMDIYILEVRWEGDRAVSARVRDT